MNEIFKGMDNAAEQINENFQSFGIVETESVDRGMYIRFGNGFYIQFIDFVHDMTRSGDRINYLFPIDESPLGAVMKPSASNYADGANVNNTILYPISGQSLRYTKDRNPWEGNESFPAVVTVWGFE